MFCVPRVRTFPCNPLKPGGAFVPITQTNSEFFPEHLPKPSLSASPSTAAEPGSNVTLKCQSHFQNVTFMLGKWQDSGYRQEQSSAGPQAEFLLTGLAPPDSGSYFCAYKRRGSQVWSEKSGPLQLVVAGEKGICLFL